MLQISIPGWESIELHYLLLDLNGTLTVDGLLLEGVKERVEFIKTKLKVFLLTADTIGTGARVAEDLGLEIFVVSPENGSQDKTDFVVGLEPQGVAAIGNGTNDAGMFERASLAIAIIGREGCSLAALRQADIAVTDINDALDLLINPVRLVATLRV